MKRTRILLGLATTATLTMCTIDSMAGYDVRLVARSGYPVINRGGGIGIVNAGAMVDAYSCFRNYNQADQHYLDGAVAFFPCSVTYNSTAFWVMPLPTQIAGTRSVRGYVTVSTGGGAAILTGLTTFSWDGLYYSEQTKVVGTGQADLTATAPNGGTANLWALLGENNAAISYAYNVL